MSGSNLLPVWASRSYHKQERLKTSARYSAACKLCSARLLSPALMLRQRMGRLDELAHPLIQDVGINLRRRDIGVAQHLLKRPQIGAAGK